MLKEPNLSCVTKEQAIHILGQKLIATSPLLYKFNYALMTKRCSIELTGKIVILRDILLLELVVANKVCAKFL